MMSWLNAAEVIVEKVTSIRYWKPWYFPEKMDLSNHAPNAMQLWFCETQWVEPRLEKAPVTMSGALRDDGTGAHAFIFLRRRGSHEASFIFERFQQVQKQFPILWLSPADSDCPANVNIVSEGPGWHMHGESVNDVICCVKRFASDPSLSQESTCDMA